MRHRVLIVDDEIAAALESGLKACAGAADFDFSIASDGAQCLAAAEEMRPDLILLDIGLPVLDGLMVLAELQRRDVRTRIIMMSGYKTDLATAIECVKAGACDYIVKGQILSRELLDRIRRALILESTLNVSVSDLPASARAMIEQASRLREEYERLKGHCEVLERRLGDEHRRLVLETGQKILYVLLCCGCVLALRLAGIVQATVALPVVFVFLIVLLLIPADKIQSISASISKVMKAKVTLNNDLDEGPKGETHK